MHLPLELPHLCTRLSFGVRPVVASLDCLLVLFNGPLALMRYYWGFRTVVSFCGTKGQWVFKSGSKLRSSSQLKKYEMLLIIT